jgi:hypothetical protein
MSASSPATRQVLYNLFWCTHPREYSAAVSGGAVCAKLEWPRPHEALILYPAFLTPAVCSVPAPSSPGSPPSSGQDFFEMLLLAPSAPQLTAEIVNRHVKISTGLDAQKWATSRPLFAEALTSDLIDVKKVESFERDAILETDGRRFRGVVDARFWVAKDLWERWRSEQAKKKGFDPPPPLDTLYQVRIDVSCITNAGPPPEDLARMTASNAQLPPNQTLRMSLWRNDEPQDQLVQTIVVRMNGEDLRHGHGFEVSLGGSPAVDLSSPSIEPIRAFHPLFVFEGLGFARLGHVADLHINARQNFLAKTTARVVEGDTETDGAASPAIGQFVNVYSDNVLSILKRLAEHATDKGDECRPAPIDVLLVGGDLIDHVKNVYPYVKRDRTSVSKAALEPAEVWDIVGLGQDANRSTYQPFVDHVTFYSLMRYFCAAYQKPVFVVSGNHDAYLEPYGISPRLAGKRNEGIPADHNLTFYEAILAFGETYGDTATVDAINLHTDLFEWFYGVFTPFRDYAVDLPMQRIVGLAWGDNEGKVWASDAHDKHGIGHLPRADKAATDRQVEIFDQALTDGAKRVVLSTHFTFVSYKNDLTNLPAPCQGVVRTTTYSKNDWGTFEERRKELYSKIHAAAGGGPGGTGPLLHCLFTGHSHRKGLYYLSGAKDHRTIVTLGTWFTRRLIPVPPLIQPKVHSEDEYPTKMYPLLWFPGGARTSDKQTVTLKQILLANAAATPIIVSDSAGPLPRMNIEGEFDEWGSDRPSGTFVSFSDGGVVDHVEAVYAERARAKPRVVVALDYLHVVQERGIARILTDKWDFANSSAKIPHYIEITFQEKFPKDRVRLSSGWLHCKATLNGRWIRVPLSGADWDRKASGGAVARMNVAPDDAPSLDELLRSFGALQFLSLKFASDDKLVSNVYEFEQGGTWDFEVSSSISFDRYLLVPKMEPPNFKLRAKHFPQKYAKKK